MPDNATSNPILATACAVLAARGAAPAILDGAGATLRTYRDILDEARSLATFIAPLAPGSVVAVRTGNDPRLPALLLALWRRGIIPAPLDLAIEREPLTAALHTARAAALMEKAASSLRILPLQPPGPAPVATHFLKLTSGTTGAPRAIRFTAAQLLADCDAVCDTMGITPADISYGVIPWSHSYGFSNLITPLLTRGIPLVASEDRLPRAILDGIARSRATVFPGLPVFFEKLAALDAAPPPALRLCISAGAPLSATVARAFRQRFGLKVHSFYGSSECGGIAYDATEGDLPEGCVGLPMRGVSLALENEPGPGSARIAGPAVGISYYPEEDPALRGGVFIPGDLIERTPHGIRLAGRTSDFINIAGRKINPAEVEAHIRTCAGVESVVVFAIPCPHRGEAPIAAVTGSATVESIRAHCFATLPGWQIPRGFWLLDALPVNERGKLNRRALADAYITQHGGRAT